MNGNRKKSTLTEDASVQTPDCLLTGASTADSPDPGNYRSRPQVPAHSDIQSFPNDSRHIEISGLLFLERSLRHRMTTNPRPWMIGRVGAIRGWNESIDCRQENAGNHNHHFLSMFFFGERQVKTQNGFFILLQRNHKHLCK